MTGIAISQNRASSNNKEHLTIQTEAGMVTIPPPSLYIGVLQEIGRRCSSKVQGAGFFNMVLFLPTCFSLCLIVQVEFKTVVSTSKDLQFSVEVSEKYALYRKFSTVHEQKMECMFIFKLVFAAFCVK